MKRERADVLLVRRGLAPSREKARAAILAGEVTSNGSPVSKAGEQLPEDSSLEVASPPPYVSRGGVKLAGALRVFGIDVAGRTVVDVGASTGGFTDCLLEAGAAKVVAIDVGYGQLAWQLRNDPRVQVMERTNIRHVDPAAIGKADVITVDVSFISVRKFLPVLLQVLVEDGLLLVLVKPQFEGERGSVGKGGIVRDPRVHESILSAFAQFVQDAGLVVRGLTYSPITGAGGNIEYWLYAQRAGSDLRSPDEPAELAGRTVAEAHAALQTGRGE